MNTTKRDTTKQFLEQMVLHAYEKEISNGSDSKQVKEKIGHILKELLHKYTPIQVDTPSIKDVYEIAKKNQRAHGVILTIYQKLSSIINE